MNCDLCGSPGTPLAQFPAAHVCDGCGFLFVPERRSPREIAHDWQAIYARKLYDPTWPGVRARLFYVAEWLDRYLVLKGKAVLDIGAGDGFFLQQVKARGGHAVGLDPSPVNVAAIRTNDTYCFHGAVGSIGEAGQYDIVTMNWTLENCGDCLEMLRWARDALSPGGHVAVATGSRILVPFKKPITSYFGTLKPDLHCYRWSDVSLRRAMYEAGLLWQRENDWMQNDVLLAVGKANDFDDKTGGGTDPHEVRRFFAEWEKFEWS